MILKYLDCSTAHITKADAEILDGKREFPFESSVLIPFSDGWIAWVPDARTLEGYCETLRDTEGLSEAFCKVLRYARAHDCERVLFDRDSSEVAELPVFEEARS